MEKSNVIILLLDFEKDYLDQYIKLNNNITTFKIKN